MKKKTLRNIIIAIVIGMVLLLAYVGIKYVYDAFRFKKEAFYTEYHLSKYEMSTMVNCYRVKVTPDVYGGSEEKNMDDWPDYSYFTMEASEDTEKVLFVLNYYLFEIRSELDKDAYEYAERLEFSKENPITSDWVLEHPHQAVDLMYKTRLSGQNYADDARLQSDYEAFMKTLNEQNLSQSEETVEEVTE